MGEVITFATGHGSTTGYLALPASGNGPGLLVLHAWWGLKPFFTLLCDRLAQEGFVVFAPDLNEGQIAQTVEQAQALMDARDNHRTASAVFGGLNALRAHTAVDATAISVIGFSMGAAWALELAQSQPELIDATVLFYGSYGVDFNKTRARFQGHFAEVDEWEPLENVQQMQAAMRAAGRSVDLHIYPGVGHWFVEEDRPEYNAPAADLAWQRMLAFLKS
ncbi:dienelactone hydrolase family protein [Candidatus Gracilibacteria bacterium]|nr:dienelactone hydrolase family protein [Candidatus Gracilibacteria bacterium]